MVLCLVKFEKQFHMLKARIDTAYQIAFQIIEASIRVKNSSNSADYSQNGESDSNNQRQNLCVSHVIFPQPDGIGVKSILALILG